MTTGRVHMLSPSSVGALIGTIRGSQCLRRPIVHLQYRATVPRCDLIDCRQILRNASTLLYCNYIHVVITHVISSAFQEYKLTTHCKVMLLSPASLL